MTYKGEQETNGSEHEVRNRGEVQVRDRTLEAGVSLNTIFTGLMLMVMSWVGYNINDIKDKIGTFAVSLAVIQNQMEQIRRDVDRHELILNSQEIHSKSSVRNGK